MEEPPADLQESLDWVACRTVSEEGNFLLGFNVVCTEHGEGRKEEDTKGIAELTTVP